MRKACRGRKNWENSGESTEKRKPGVLSKGHPAFLRFERRRRDSNPRAPEGKRISSAPRYDRFDTSPNVSILSKKTHLGKPFQGIFLILPYFSIIYLSKK